MEWLVQYFNNPNAPNPIDISSSMCVHGNLDLNKIQDVKAVSVEVANDLYKEVMKDKEVSLILNPGNILIPKSQNLVRYIRVYPNSLVYFLFFPYPTHHHYKS